MKELLTLDDERISYHSGEYNEPLLDYVSIIAEQYMPFTEADWECGCIGSSAVGHFVHRYFGNKIEKRFEHKFIENKEIQESIKSLGYDVDKFWYLLLFAYDYSCGMCLNGIVSKKSPKEQINNLFLAIIDNTKSINKNNDEVTFESSAKIVLEIKGKRKITIEDPLTIFYLAGMSINILKNVKEGSLLSQSTIDLKIENGKIQGETKSNSVHIWYFAKMLLTFFDLKSSFKTRKKKGATISLSKKLLVSRLIYITGLSKNVNFLDSEDTLKGYLKQYKDYQLDLENSLYS